MSTGPVLSAKLSLEPLDRRDLLSVYTWTGMVDTDATNMSNWSVMQEMVPGQPPPPPPDLPDGDNELIFNGMAFNSRDCDGLTSATDSFAIVRIQSGYNGTVALGEALTFGVFDLASGAIAQPTSGTDLNITGAFTWTGGTLNNTPSAATVNMYGGGSIVLPGVGNTITTGSTLNFASLGGPVQTTITGAGDLLLNGTNADAIFVRADANVVKPVQVGSVGAVKGVNSTTQKLTIEPNAFWGYTGSGTDKLELQVVNNGGKFFLSGQVTMQLTGGGLNNPAYDQGTANNNSAQLEIMNGCNLDVSAAPKGVSVRGGNVTLTGNPNLPKASQVALITGKYTMSGGVIGFITPTQATDGLIWGTFQVIGDVLWSGGVYAPGLDCEPTRPKSSNNWVVAGTMTIDASGASKPTIVPVPQFLPPGQQPVGTWTVIQTEGPNSQIQGDNPELVGWTLLPEIMNGVKKKFSVKKP